MAVRGSKNHHQYKPREITASKRILALVVAILFFIGTVILAAVSAFGAELTDEAPSVTQDAPATTCESILLYDAKTGTILYEKNAEIWRTPASITKVMTCLVTLENVEDLDQEVTITKDMLFPTGSNMALKEGEVLTYAQLLDGLMVCSANDGALALAISVGGSVDGFVTMMNDKAAELGMEHTHYQNPNGYTNDIKQHHTTCFDLKILVDYALQNDTFRKLVKQPKVTIAATNLSEERKLKSTNWMLYDEKTTIKVGGAERHPKYEGTYGIKTGMMASSGYCLISGVKREDQDLICICLKGAEEETRYIDSIALYDWGFENYDTLELLAPKSDTGRVRVKYGKHTRVSTTCPAGAYATVVAGTAGGAQGESDEEAVPNSDESAAMSGTDTSYEIVLDEDVEAPIKKGTQVGRVDIFADGKLVGQPAVVIDEDVEKGGPWSRWYISDALAYTVLGVLGLLILLLVVRRFNKRRYEKMRRSRRYRARHGN